MRRLRNMIQVDVLLRRGVTICGENHVTYYLARIKYLLAENAYENKFEQEEVKELIRDAARIWLKKRRTKTTCNLVCSLKSRWR